MDILKPVIKLTISLFLAVQVWAWLRFLGAFWLSDGFDLIDGLFLSVHPLKFSLYGFLYTAIPAALLYFFVHGKVSRKYMLMIYAGGAAVLAMLYTLTITGFPFSYNLSWVLRQGSIMMLVAMFSGVVFFVLADSSLLGKGRNIKVISSVNHVRREILSGFAVLLGGLGFAGSTVGPIRILKNSTKFVDLDLSSMLEGEFISVEISKRPIWIIKRTKLHIAELLKQNNALIDPKSLNSRQPDNTRNAFRSIKPEYFVVEAVCTHLGCLPAFMPNGPSKEDLRHSIRAPQLFCPCHGGVFDLAGRVYINTPAPTNLSIPDHEFISENTVRIYYPSLKGMWFG